MILSLSLLALLLPTLFSLGWIVEKEMKEMMGRQRLEVAWDTFYGDLYEEIGEGSDFRLDERGDFHFELGDGRRVRYRQDSRTRSVVREVKRVNESHYKGRTVLLQEVYYAAFVPMQEGVYVDIGLQNWTADLEINTFIRSRRERLD
ncbi:hypothetical protein [Mechercharimyces sp. CAU 1602]|uniref:hypothetical protein n=1 Tax=Mechercharimyces sp. CAU 1602 TaxID=2973933 RepID=UPI0021614120|nr:hypothetical protein [Mechercharimyces sp. CAU 1602]MCS1350547.1 hypothetical protein [Mechercharimyces sp. CAU 1602]